MKLSKLIAKSGNATATAATSATPQGKKAASVATVAGVAVANSQSEVINTGTVATVAGVAVANPQSDKIAKLISKQEDATATAATSATHLEQEAEAYLLQNSAAKYGIATEHRHDGVFVAVAIRDKAVCTLRIPADKWDEFTFMRLLAEEHTA